MVWDALLITVLLPSVNKECDLARGKSKQRYSEKEGRVTELPAASGEARCKVTSDEPHHKISNDRSGLI